MGGGNKERDRAEANYNAAHSAATAESPFERARRERFQEMDNWFKAGDYRQPPPSMRLMVNFADPAERAKNRAVLANTRGQGVSALGAGANATVLALDKQHRDDELERDNAIQYQDTLSRAAGMAYEEGADLQGANDARRLAILGNATSRLNSVPRTRPFWQEMLFGAKANAERAAASAGGGYRRGGDWSKDIGKRVTVGEDGPELVVDEEGNASPVGLGGPETVIPTRPATVIPNAATELPFTFTRERRPRRASAHLADAQSTVAPEVKHPEPEAGGGALAGAGLSLMVKNFGGGGGGDKPEPFAPEFQNPAAQMPAPNTDGGAAAPLGAAGPSPAVEQERRALADRLANPASPSIVGDREKDPTAIPAPAGEISHDYTPHPLAGESRPRVAETSSAPAKPKWINRVLEHMGDVDLLTKRRDELAAQRNPEDKDGRLMTMLKEAGAGALEGALSGRGALMGAAARGLHAVAAPNVNERRDRDREVARLGDQIATKQKDVKTLLDAEEQRAGVEFKDEQTKYWREQKPREFQAKLEDKELAALFRELSAKKGMQLSPDDPLVAKLRDRGIVFDVDAFNDRASNLVSVELVDPANPQQKRRATLNKATGEVADVGQSGYVAPRGPDGMTESERQSLGLRRDALKLSADRLALDAERLDWEMKGGISSGVKRAHDAETQVLRSELSQALSEIKSVQDQINNNRIFPGDGEKRLGELKTKVDQLRVRIGDATQRALSTGGGSGAAGGVTWTEAQVRAENARLRAAGKSNLTDDQAVEKARRAKRLR